MTGPCCLTRVTRVKSHEKSHEGQALHLTFTMQTQIHKGWVVEFRKHIHMYCHSLRLSKGEQSYDVPCEDTPAGFVGIWPYELKVADVVLQDICVALREWASQSGMRYRLYTSAEKFEANDSCA